MRAHGVLSHIPEAGTSDHVCWVYDDDAAFDRAVEEFLAGGLARGERLLCVGERVIDRLQGLTLPERDVPALIASGALETQTLAQAYEAAGPFLPENCLSYYETATQRALDEGYRGLRVIAEASVLAADPVTRSALVRWEHVADDFIAQNAVFTAMCAYSGELTGDALADVTSVHPLVQASGAVPTFRVFFDDERLVLAGSVDTFSAGRLARVLASSPVGPGGAVLDVSLLDFADVAGCRTLALWVRDLRHRSLAVEVRGASPLFRRMWEILMLDELAAAGFAESAA